MLSDLRIALRVFRARPLYAVVAIVTLSLVVGAGSAVLAVINATLIRPLPFADESRLLAVYCLPPGSRSTTGGTALFSPVYVRFRERLQSVDKIAASWFRERALIVNGEAEAIETAAVSANYFHVLGLQPA